MLKNNSKSTDIPQALDHPVTITSFRNQRALAKKELRLSLCKLASKIEQLTAARKDKLPWLKLATFGDVKSAKGCLRTNGNVVTITGLEADYDAGRMKPEAARNRLAKAGVAALIYTTPSHTPEAPRWRVLCPFSGPLPPDTREDFMARLNGVLGGSLDPTSFTLSQAYYAGGVEGGAKVQTYLVDGEFIDKVEGLKPIYKHGGKTKPDPIEAEPAEDQSDIPEAVGRAQAMLESAKDKIMKAQERTPIIYGQAFRLGGYVACNTLDPERVLDELLEAAEAVGHQATYGDEETKRTILNGLAEGENFPQPWFDPVSLLDECWTPLELSIKAAEAFDAELLEELEESVETPAGTGYFAPASDWAGLPVPPRKWHVEDLIPGNTVTILGGDGGTGKSLLALQLAVATATGTSWLGREIDQPGKTLVLSAEDDDDELQRRVAAICEAQGLPRSSLGKMLVRSTACEETLLATLDGKTNTLKATAIYKKISASMKQDKPSLLVLDTLADLHAGNENDRAHARQFIGLLRHLAIEYQCAVVLLAHPSLTGMNTGTGLSGSTAWNASVRSRLYLKRVKEEGYEADPDARTLETMKANYGPTGGAIALRWINGVFVPDLPGDDREDRNAKAERVFLKLLAEFNKNGRRVSPKNGSNLASKVFAEHPDTEGVSKKAFKMAMEVLLSAGKITVEEEGSPSKRRQYLAGGLL
jgi:RecA-family ATPase